MFESKSGVLFIGGLAFFFLAFISNALVPIYMYRDLPEQPVRELVNENLLYQFEDLHKRYKEPFEASFGTPPADDAEAETWYADKCADALLIGRKVYTAEGCWHCHSQFVRPVSREEDRWGEVAAVYEYQNELQRPVLFGTRRVGPDLSREGGRRSNDWHTVHFFQPTMVEPTSPMPEYTWLFDGAPDKPNKKGLALITYVQWMGSWLKSYPYYERYVPITGAESGVEDE